METQLQQDETEDKRSRAIVVLIVGFVTPFAVLLLSGMAEWWVRALYAMCLAAVVLGGGFWVAFRAKPEELVRRWTPSAVRPVWAMVVRICGVLVMIGAVWHLVPATFQDVVELLSSGRPTTFVEAARGVEGRTILHPVFQTVRLRGNDRHRQVYMFAYGGKRLLEGRRYVVAVLRRSHWILSAREETQTASQ